MDSNHFFQLTLGVYRVTELFPKGEPLKLKIIEKALEILSDLVLASPNPGVKRLEDAAPAINKNIKIIADFFDLAQSQKWIDSRNFLVLKREYNKIKQNIETELGGIGYRQDSKVKDGDPSEISSNQLFPRQKRIIDILKQNGGAQAGEILKSFEKLSKRTLRRDLGRLVREGMIERVGRCNKVFYKLPTLS